jgi:polyisoprenoid-binding protein YceI
METLEKQTKSRIWTLDKAHAKLGFSITHMLVSEVEGAFKAFDIKLTSANEDFTGAEIEVTAEVNSIDTGNEMRDAHLKKEDFFHAEKNPQLLFKSKSFVKIAEKKYVLNGDLTFNGVTNNINLDVTGNMVKHPFKENLLIAGFKIKGDVKRSDFKFGSSMPGIVLSEDVMINANVEFTSEVTEISKQE